VQQNPEPDVILRKVNKKTVLPIRALIPVISPQSVGKGTGFQG